MNNAYISAADMRTNQISTDHLMVKDTASFLNYIYSYGNRSLDVVSNGTAVSCPRPEAYLLGCVMNNPWNMSPEGLS